VWMTEADAATLTGAFRIDGICHYFDFDDATSDTPGTIYDTGDVTEEYASCTACLEDSCPEAYCFVTGNPRTCNDCTPKFVVMRLAGWTTCTDCVRVNATDSVKLTGSVNRDYCIPYVGPFYTLFMASGGPITHERWNGSTTCSGSPSSTSTSVSAGLAIQTASSESITFGSSVTAFAGPNWSGSSSVPYPTCMSSYSFTPAFVGAGGAYCPATPSVNQRWFQEGTVEIIPCGCDTSGLIEDDI
jgi:hypothetical protein